MAETPRRDALGVPDGAAAEALVAGLPVARPEQPARYRPNSLYAVVPAVRAQDAVLALEFAGIDLDRVTVFAGEADAAMLSPAPKRQGMVRYFFRMIWGDEIQFGTRYAEAVRAGDVVLRVRGDPQVRRIAARALLAHEGRLVNSFGRLTFRTLAP